MTTKLCPICEKPFILENHNQRYCTDCRTNRQKDIDAYLANKRAGNKKPIKKKPRSLKRVLSDLETYNQKHGTHLTYGKYVAMTEHGKGDY